MELIVTIAYYFLVRLIFFDYKLIRFNLFWKFVVFGLYAAAAMTEILMLGQYTPYSKEGFVAAYVIPLGPEYGGIVSEVHIDANEPVEKGSPLFSMDPTPWQDKLEEAKAQYAVAKDTYDRLVRAGVGAVTALDIDTALQQMRAAQAERDKAQYNVNHSTVYAPSHGYAVNLQLRPGTYIRLKQPVMDFVSDDEYWVVGVVNQKAARWIASGNPVEVAFALYPGKVFPGKIDQVIWATAQAQLMPGGVLPQFKQMVQPEFFAFKVTVDEDPDYPLRFGSQALVAVYTGKGAAVFKLLRQLEIRSESFLNYVYNPF